jgi:hypothetical protein
MDERLRFDPWYLTRGLWQALAWRPYVNYLTKPIGDEATNFNRFCQLLVAGRMPAKLWKDYNDNYLRIFCL